MKMTINEACLLEDIHILADCYFDYMNECSREN